MRKIFVAVVLAGLVGAGLQARSAAEEESGCVACHTDAAKLKALYVPPKIQFKMEAGEG